MFRQRAWARCYQILAFLFVSAVIVLCAFVSGNTSRATTFSWTDAVPTLSVEAVSENSECSMTPIKVATDTIDPTTLSFTKTVSACITIGQTVDYATSYSASFIKYKSDSSFHELAADPQSILVPDTNILFEKVLGPNGNSPDKLKVYDDLPNQLSIARKNIIGVVTSYSLVDEKGKMLFTNDDASARSVYTYAISSNGRYVLAYLDYEGFAVTDLDTDVTRFIDRQRSAWYYAPDIPQAGAVSDDGRYAYIARSPKIIDTEGCGDLLDSLNYRRSELDHPCASRDIYSTVQEKVGYPFRTSEAEFADDGQTLEFTTNIYPGVNGYPDATAKRVTMHGSGYTPVAQLDYLALGDSYSSGEGDVERKTDGSSFYAQFDDNDSCHLSSRSYPYLLRDFMGIDSSKMRSVACSGAIGYVDFYGDTSSYFGQGNRIKGRTDLAGARQLALNEFRPGYIRQLEFVKKYQPKVVTVTAGGNDIGFADILLYCASPSLQMVVVDDTCGYAEQGSFLKKLLGENISDQYYRTRLLVERIKKVSPSTHVYVVGYPSFVSDSWLPCLNTGALDSNERTMINQGVLYMNDVLESAAKNSGATYLDIKNSLVGGRLCESSEYLV